MPVVVHPSGHTVTVSDRQASALARLGDYELASEAGAAPARNESREVWAQWALDAGAAPDEVGHLTRGELIDLYG